MKIWARLLGAIDTLACLIFALTIIAIMGGLIVVGGYYALREAFHSLQEMYADSVGKIILAASATSVVWCIVRWKTVTRRRFS
jgi:hypothetical protein